MLRREGGNEETEGRREGRGGRRMDRTEGSVKEMNENTELGKGKSEKRKI